MFLIDAPSPSRRTLEAMLTADDITDYLLSKEIKMNGEGITNLDVQLSIHQFCVTRGAEAAGR
jgi:hypothetical protein